MNPYIKYIIESYFSSTEQMNAVLKDAKELMKQNEKMKDVRTEFIQGILGKTTFRRFDNEGLFAPVPLNGIKLTGRDMSNIYPEMDDEKTDKFIEKIAAKYPNCDFILRDNMDEQIKTDIVFKTIDDIIDFFYAVYSAYKKTYRRDDLNWKPVVKKFREYLR